MPAHMREAFTFSLEQRPGQEGEECQAISSLVFVEELNNCATDFKRYMTGLALNSKAVVTDLAMGIVWEALKTPTRAPQEQAEALKSADSQYGAEEAVIRDRETSQVDGLLELPLLSWGSGEMRSKRPLHWGSSASPALTSAWSRIMSVASRSK